VVEVLERLDVRATFFIQGRWAEAYPSLARRIAARHQLGNHSLYHARMTHLSRRGLRADVKTAEAAIRTATAVDPRPWFRCPFGTGADSPTIISGLQQLGYRHVGWHVECFEWEPTSSVASVQEAAITGAISHGDGAVVLLHPWPDPVASALPLIVEHLRGAGASLVRVDELDLPGGLEPIGFPRPAATA
jgi:peptidoglycan-N-acetylglucosamine deacetylase